jgi:hypothetical protein
MSLARIERRSRRYPERTYDTRRRIAETLTEEPPRPDHPGRGSCRRRPSPTARTTCLDHRDRTHPGDGRNTEQTTLRRKITRLRREETNLWQQLDAFIPSGDPDLDKQWRTWRPGSERGYSRTDLDRTAGGGLPLRCRFFSPWRSHPDRTPRTVPNRSQPVATADGARAAQIARGHVCVQPGRTNPSSRRTNPATRTVRAQLAADGKPLTRQRLAKELRKDGHSVSNEPLGRLLTAVRNPIPTDGSRSEES